MAILSSAFNITVLLYRIYLLAKCSSWKKFENWMLISLAFSDLLLSIYLIIIAFASSWFEGGYGSHSYSWRNGIICKVLAAVSTVTSQWSLGILGLIAGARCLIIKSKGMAELKVFRSTIVCLFNCLMCTFTSIIPLIILEYRKEEYTIISDVCLLLSFIHRQFSGMEYSMTPFITTNVIVLILICACYCNIIMEVFNTGKAVQGKGQSSKESRYRKTYIKLSLLMLSNILYWIPLDILLIVSLACIEVPPVLANWFAVFVLPLGALTNPFIFTFDQISLASWFGTIFNRK